MNKKVHATKTESAASVISKVLNNSDDEVTLYIPKGADFGKSRNNFLLLKRETRAAGKIATVESVDDDILELAATAGLRAANPFLGKRQRAVSDIVSVRSGSKQEEREIEVETEETVQSEELEEEKSVDVEVKEKGRFGLGVPRRKEEKTYKLDKGDGYGIEGDGPDDEVLIESPKGKKKSKLGWSTIIGVAIVVIMVFIILATWVFPKATIALELEKTDWDFVGSLNVGTSITSSSFSDDTVNLRGMSLSERKNFTKTYPATGSDFVERGAKGTMIVYNAYSSDPQELVERTRFVTPDGKVYRMDHGIVVPGANIVDGQIAPSSIEVPVTSDEAGEEYNIGPVPRFRIPGFQGSPKYDGFYGESVEPMTGGFIGERKIATEEDIASARGDIIGNLEESAKTQLFLNLPEGTKILDDTYSFEIAEEVVDEGSSDSDTFSITIYGEASVIIFVEDELIGVFEERVEADTGVDLEVRDYTIDYGEPRFNEEGNQFGAAINVDSVWTRPFDEERFKNEASGKNEEELKTLIFSVPGVMSGGVNFWPFWINRVPEKATRIVVDVN